MNDRHILEELKKLLNQSTDWELALEFLRNIGFSKIESIEMLRKAASLSYYEAESIVHNSKTWNDVKMIDEKVNDNFFDLLERSGNSN